MSFLRLFVLSARQPRGTAPQTTILGNPHAAATWPSSEFRIAKHPMRFHTRQHLDFDRHHENDFFIFLF